MKKYIHFRIELADLVKIKTASKIEKQSATEFILIPTIIRADNIIIEYKKKVINNEGNSGDVVGC
jgi:uncharacterized protein (DUF1778 family)